MTPDRGTEEPHPAQRVTGRARGTRLILAASDAQSHDRASWVRFEQSLHDNRCPEENIVDAMFWAHEHMREERAVALEKLRVQLVATFYPSCIINGTVH